MPKALDKKMAIGSPTSHTNAGSTNLTSRDSLHKNSGHHVRRAIRGIPFEKLNQVLPLSNSRQRHLRWYSPHARVATANNGIKIGNGFASALKKMVKRISAAEFAKRI